MNNIIELAYVVDKAMKEFIHNNPENKKQEDCENYVMKQVMTKTKGSLNPNLTIQIVKFHKMPMQAAGFMLQC